MRTIQIIEDELAVRRSQLESTRSEASRLLARQAGLDQVIKSLEAELEEAKKTTGVAYITIKFKPTGRQFQANPGTGITYNLDIMWPGNPANSRVGMVGHYVVEFPKVFGADGKRVYKSGITDAWLKRLDAGLEYVGKMGKLIRLRFSYENSPVNNNANGDDAPLDVMLEDIDKVGPYLQKHQGKILMLHKGWTGDWGEQEKSKFGNHLPEPQRKIDAALRKWYSGPIAERCPWHLRNLGFKSPAEARAAGYYIHNDSSMAWWDGTYKINYMAPPHPSEQEQKDFVGGITADFEIMEKRTPIKMTGAAVMAEIQRYGALIYNGDSPGRDQLPALGINYGMIEAAVGYKFVAEACKLPERVAAGAEFEIEIVGRNAGNAQPLRPYKLSLCLWPKAGGTPVMLPLEGNPQHWAPQQPWRVAGTVKALAAGEYYSFLAIDDAQMADDYRYRIALDNEWPWGLMVKANSRLNDLGHVIVVV